MNNYTLYSIGCPKCTVLEKKLKQKSIPFTICSDIEAMKEKGYKSLPILEVNGESLKFEDAVKWVNAYEH